MLLQRIYYRLINIPLKLLVRIKVLPENPIDTLEIDTNKPIVYILKTRSASSFGMLEQECEKYNLPKPKIIDKNSLQISNGTVFFLQKKTFLGLRHDNINKYQKLFRYIIEHKNDELDQYQLIPISIFWGRNPGKEKSIFRLFFYDTESASRFRKLFILLFQGRNSFLQFGKPLELDNLKIQSHHKDPARKLTRVLRVYYHRQKKAAMGPLLADRKEMITGVLAQDDVIQAIQREQRQANTTYDDNKKIAYKYADEIIANYSYTTIRAFGKLLSWLWNKIFDGIVITHSDRIQTLAKDHELVYVPCHRSHMDYLLMSYLLYYEGLVPPHIAAGINLNFWPVGSIFRGCGAFFIRRSFAGNKLYTAIFNNYLRLLLEKGYPIEFFPEGGRSRTGRLLHPKTGMLSMVIQNFRKGTKKPIALVPVYIGYERVMEAQNYVKEMKGSKKKKESMGQVLKIRRQLKKRFGKVYVNFAEPIHIDRYLDTHQPQWQQDKEEKPVWFSNQVEQIGKKIMTNINSSAVINSINLTSLILLSTQRHTMDKDELINQMDFYLSLLQQVPYHNDVVLPKEKSQALLRQAILLSSVSEFEHPLGNLCQIPSKAAVLLTYYRNNIIHLFAIPSLIASCFRHKTTYRQTELQSLCYRIYPFLQRELFLHHHQESFNTTIQDYLHFFQEKGLLFSEGDTIHRCHTNTTQFTQLMSLGSLLNETLERYAISLTLLSNYVDKAPVSRKHLELESRKMTQRMSVLFHINAPESSDNILFQHIIAQLKDDDYIGLNDANEIIINEKVINFKNDIRQLLSLATQEALSQINRWWQIQIQEKN